MFHDPSSYWKDLREFCHTANPPHGPSLERQQLERYLPVTHKINDSGIVMDFGWITEKLYRLWM